MRAGEAGCSSVARCELDRAEILRPPSVASGWQALVCRAGLSSSQLGRGGGVDRKTAGKGAGATKQAAQAKWVIYIVSGA